MMKEAEVWVLRLLEGAMSKGLKNIFKSWKKISFPLEPPEDFRPWY